MFIFRLPMHKRNSLNTDTREITLEPADNARLLSLCGPFDDNIKQLERRLGIEINRRDNHFKLTGRPICITAAADILRSLYVDTAPMRGQTQDIEPEQIHLAIKEARVLEQSAESVPEFGKAVNIKTKRGVIKPRTPNQAQYIANILDHDITFGVGPAGTGKTPPRRCRCRGCAGASGDPPNSADPSGGRSGRKTGLPAGRSESEG